MMSKTEPFAVVTGASRGIGRALCEGLLARGWHVCAVSRSGAGPDGAWSVACDLSIAAGRADLLAELGAARRLVDLFVNNAGIQQALDFATGDAGLAEAAETELALNLLTPVVLTAGAVPLMRQPGGVIVNVTSLVALHPKTSAPVYSASKAGLASFTAAMRRQLAPLGLKVIEVAPPVVATDMTAGRNEAALGVTAMAAAILDGIDRGRDVVAPGKAGLVRRLNRVAPGLVAGRIGAM